MRLASGLALTLPITWRITWDLATPPGRDVPRSFPLFIPLNSHNNPVKLDLRTFDNGRNRPTENDLAKITWQVNGRVTNRTYFCPNPKPVFFPTMKDFPNDSLTFVWHFIVYKALLFHIHFPASWKSPYFKHRVKQTDMYECSHTLIIKVAIKHLLSNSYWTSLTFDLCNYPPR